MPMTLTKKQIAHNAAISILRNLANHANSIKRVLEKGVDDTGQAIRCSPEEVKSAMSADQLEKVEAFVDDFYEDPPKPPQPPRFEGSAGGSRAPQHPDSQKPAKKVLSVRRG